LEVIEVVAEVGRTVNAPSVAVVFMDLLKVTLIAALVAGAGGPFVWPAVVWGETLLTCGGVRSCVAVVVTRAAFAQLLSPAGQAAAPEAAIALPATSLAPVVILIRYCR